MTHGRRATRSALLLALLVLLGVRAWARAQQAPPAAVPGEIKLSVDPAQSKVNWILGSTLHTVHGTFAFKRGEVRIDPASGSASGEFVVDATSGKSGNDSRDSKMHKQILESAKYTEVVFRPTRIDGKVLAQGASNVQVHGTFLLHGSEHEISVPVQAELTASQWKGSAKFSVPYVQWGLKSPNTFLLRADPTVQVELELTGSVRLPGQS